jgi:DMSO/TMAO reductase YedYZ molybdopterin-dependent catalytic subunit
MSPFNPSAPPISRRELFRQSGLIAVGLAVTPVPGWPMEWFRVNEEVVPFTDVPASFTGRRPTEPEPHPGANLLAQDLRRLSEWVTPIEDFFVVSHYDTPVVDAATYRLSVGGLVQRPLTLSLDEIRARPSVESTTVFECGGNSRAMLHGMVGNAVWRGVELLPLLEQAGVTEAREVQFWGADSGTEEIRGGQRFQHFGRGMSLTDLLETQPILAYEMNGRPLPVVHGFPLRLIVPGWYGVGQVKWLNRIELAEDRLATRFMARDYVTLRSVERDGTTEWVETAVTRQRPKSVIARVTSADGNFTIFGAAWSDGTPLSRVEVRVGEGQWATASLQAPANPFSWTFFTHRVPALPAGEHTLVSRAIDQRGRTQPADLSNKVTRWENNELFTRTIRVG